ncbi:putative NIMA-related kinase [Trypanosoma theileri]|uniref:non-specific serine/threonine protein kinase n=1 Tax=Trypanosoma theileri TaxID=67003 RepID=A0A1X0NHD4_9TRYP|nr:putative NIMA-related kinase [Trypanosoma theileri]ORC84174.1 putative NIMA-related kinase [Trypanosoma theileri]
MDKYVQVRVLGKGSFGSAWLVQRRSDKVQLVAKEVRLAGMKPAERESAKHEIDVLRTLNHPNITRYVDHYEHHGSLFIVMEYANGGDLYSKIKSRKGNRFTETEILHYFSQLCLALLHLHERHILHRDLKTQNVFLTTDGVVKLGDFGISTILRNTFELKRTVCGTPYYFSPELCLNKPYNNKSDVWALGCILYELTTLTHAFDGSNMKALVQKILKGVYPPIHSSYSTNLSKLISAMLQIDPKLRPNVSQIISTPYIRESLSSLQKVVEVAHHDCLPCKPSPQKGEVAQPAQQDGQMRAEERRREEQAKAMKMAKERQQLRLQMEQRQRENEERLRNIQAQQRQQEIEHNLRKKELEARAREQRRHVEKRAKAQALIQKQREEEWERNMREHAESIKRKQREEERVAREKAEQEALRERLFNNKNENKNSPPNLIRNLNHNNDERPKDNAAPSAAEAAELYREMRRQAALNKQRLLEDMRAAPVLGPIAVAGVEKPSPMPARDIVNPKPQRSNSLGKMTAEEAEEARRQAFWQMRREAQENKRRALGLDNLPEEVPLKGQVLVAQPGKPNQQPQPVQQQQQQVEEQVEEQKKEKQHVQTPQPPQKGGDWTKDTPAVVHAKRTLAVGGAPAASPVSGDEVKNGKDVQEDVSAPSNDACEVQKREDDYNALQTVIDDALMQGGKGAVAEDFSDEAFPDTDLTKFMLDGQTLVLPNVQATDPLMHRIESLRLFLEGKLGERSLVGCYRQMNNIATDDDEAMYRVANMLPEEHQKYIPLIAQLIVCEDAFNRQLVQ